MKTQLQRSAGLHAGFASAIAARASNAAEQIRIAEAIGAVDDRTITVGTLSRLDGWKVEQLARGLAGGRPDARTATAGRSRTQLAEIFAANRLLRHRVGGRSRVEPGVLAAVHDAWLPTYTAALRAFDPGFSTDGEPAWEERRRRLARACAPFCALLRGELEATVRSVNAACSAELVRVAVARAFEEHLIDRFEMSLAWAIETDQNVAFVRMGIERRSATAGEHDDYFERTFRDAEACHEFYLRFPVLGRWLATVTRHLCEGGACLVRRLAGDAERIGAELFDASIVAFSAVSLGKSDYHAGGRSVAVVDVALESGCGSLVYKPRDLGSERAMQGLLRRLDGDGVVGFAPHRVVAMDGYGYEELIPADRNHVDSPAAAAHVYEQLGGFLAIFYVLGGSDLHFENLMVADGHVFVCDCETVLGTVLPGQQPGTGTVLDSVLRTGLLDWPLAATAEIVLKLSGVTGGETYEMPFAVPRVQDGPALSVRYETGIRVEQSAPNRVYLDGQIVDPRGHEHAITRGFCQVHDWFRLQPAASRCVERLFADTVVRLVARSTQVYAQLLIGARHPRCLTEPLEVDLVFGRLGEGPLAWDGRGLAADAEARSLWQLDVPTFAARADATELVADHAAPVGVDLVRSPLHAALGRIAALSTEDRDRQLGYIRASLSVDEVRSPSFVTTAVEYAQLVGDELCRVFEEPAPLARWSYVDDGSDADVRGTLYYGSAGVALFLAYLDAIAPQERLRRAAELALEHALAHEPGGIGAFDGLAGHVYVLTHLHALWGESRLLRSAIATSERLDALIDADRAFDVLSGSAGVIAVMLSLDRAAGTGLDTAHRCARHLLRHAERAESGCSWAPPRRDEAVANVTGFAHGAGGIGWALIALGAATSRDEYVDAGRQAFAYERLHFDEEREDWYDLRTSVLEMTGGRRHFANAWCNGAPGIGLSRLASWDALGKDDDELLRETYLALASTLRNFAGAGNDTLCHGRSGNAELLLRFAHTRDEPAFELEANMHAQACWRRLASTPGWPRVEDGRQPITGLMVGIAGAGMHFLRLAHPARVPSPLLLDPPQSNL